MKRLLLLVVLLGGTLVLRAAELPITDVILYSSGVGYMQRAGTVTDNTTVQLSFKPEQIDDLLKSLVLLDLDGGQVGAVSYGSKEPIGKTLGSFAINLADNPSLAQLLNRMRGVEVEIVATNTFTGTILGVEKKKVEVGKEREVIEVDVLNLLTDTGIRAVRLDEIVSIRILDERLDNELKKALKVLATGLDNQRRPVSITFDGKGARRVVVGYVTEAPVWKTSYRLVLSDKESLLQGWAIVDNTSDADWTNVHLALVSGRPISFTEDLYTPLYAPRPVVMPHLFASLRPVEYGANLDQMQEAAAENDEGMGGAGEQRQRKAGALRGANNMNGPGMPMAAAPMLSAGRFADRDMEKDAQASVVSAAVAQNLGQAFAYNIKAPVTLPRQQSALLPIVTGPVETWQLSIYNADVQPKFPLYGLRVKNTTGVHLMGGPITVYNDGAYAGDATFEDLQPSEQRLISYAVDLGMEGNRTEENGMREIMAITLAHGNLNVLRKFQRTVKYVFAVKDGKDRKLMVEHRYLPGWDLVSPKPADERTDTLYRFTLPVKASEGGKLTVVEEQVQSEVTGVVDIDTPTLVMYMKTGKISPAVREALQHVVELQGKLLDLRTQRQQKEQEIQNISNEQARIRQNMGQLDRTSDLYRRYVTMLDAQETQIGKLRDDIADLQKRENAQRKALEDYVNGLDLK